MQDQTPGTQSRYGMQVVTHFVMGTMAMHEQQCWHVQWLRPKALGHTRLKSAMVCYYKVAV